MLRSRSRSRSRSPPRRPRDEDRYRSDRDYDRKRRDDRRDDRDRYPGDRRREYSRDRDRRERERSPRRYDDRDRERDRDRRPGPSRRSRSRSKSNRSGSRSKSEEVDKAKPNFKQSGLLAAETNTIKHTDGTSTFLKYNEPPEARKPTLSWRLYVFKGKEQVDLLHISRQSAYLIGRDRVVCDIPIEHPSCSKQHAAIQFRHVAQKDEFGNVKATVKPFVIDLESTNGTFVNDEETPKSRYYELVAGDVVKFGQSQREYVLLHDEAA